MSSVQFFVCVHVICYCVICVIVIRGCTDDNGINSLASPTACTENKQNAKQH